MGIWQGLRNKLGLADAHASRSPIRVFLLDDDTSRHSWFARRFPGDHLDVAVDVPAARALLDANYYDAVFLDHDLLPEHYKLQSGRDDERTGYAIASWLAATPRLQPAATIIVHTRNPDGAMRMVELMRTAGRRAEYVPFPMLEQKIKSYWER